MPNSGSYALVGGTIHPVSKPSIDHGVLLLKDGLIVGVGPDGTAVPPGFTRVNVSGKEVYPGFIDAGSDVGLNEVGSVKSMKDDQENGPFQPDLQFLTSVNPESVKIPIARCGGVTSAFVRPSGKGLVMGQGAVVNMAGSTPEQMVVGTARGMFVQFPEGVNPAFKAFLPANVVEEREKAVETNKAALNDYFLAAKRYGDARGAGLVAVDAQMEALVPYLAGKQPVYVVGDAQKTITEALAWTKGLGMKMVLVGGADAWKVAKDLKGQGVPVILSAPTTSCPGANGPYGNYDPYDARMAGLSVLGKAGVKFCLQGGDSAGIMNLPWGAGMPVAYGLSHDEAVRSITLSAAEILGVGAELGSLDAGKQANVVVFDGDPLEITSQLEYEFIKGKPQVLKSHFTELYRKYEKRLSE